MRILTLLLLLPAIAAAEPAYVCRAADGSRTIQARPCHAPKKHRISPQLAGSADSQATDREIAVMCAYHRQLAEYFNAIASDTVSSSLGSAYNKQAEESELYLRQHCQ